jgi:hypothetical protein
VTLKELYALMLREFPPGWTASPFAQNDLAGAGFRWVMDLDSYKEVRAACRAAGAIYPPGEEDRDEWAPKPEDQLFGLPVEVRDDGGSPHLERARRVR